MIDSTEMAIVDRNAVALGVRETNLMESAGNAVARAVRDLDRDTPEVAVLAGRGNNGGDALTAARFLADLDPTVHLLGHPDRIRSAVTREKYDALQSAEVATNVIRDASALSIGEPEVIIDGVLGTGVSGTPREPERTAIQAINDSEATVVSVDVPSGMDVDTGERPGDSVVADRVVTFHDTKPGLADHENVTVANIGIPPAAERFTGPGDLQRLTRPTDAHKGDFGRVLVVGGGPYTGAPALAAQAALRAGADLATVLTPEPVADQVQGFSEDLIVRGLPGTRIEPTHVSTILEAAADQDVMILGPGLGAADPTREAVGQILEAYEGKAVVDADAISVVSAVETDASLILTPHRGEFQQLGGESADDRDGWATSAAQVAADLGQTLLLKGPHDVVTDGDRTRINRTGNPGMTVGGTGDVLAGVTGATFATLDPVPAAAVAAYLTGTAGDLAAESRNGGLLASDLLGTLPPALGGEQA
ncbi:NAD(P)H-hydrate dehydratase [Halodesulfurarchaeum sp. HSR-GB]|uniref:NAD(P)H-hydrate dehydratase n=1 Tax=Halodesulfurarchaeum sp. HSR-GB TaxID=3074077 RepID=UPI002860FE37|nr:NAD(P)H-hydrate dehydratase [Halodesulfurarchaeum sp. HSR-GB]MDR5655593.1 NAD(P)H-hydrate dehydratase [Halodesulfurarchaeum sp. HSR-GB]